MHPASPRLAERENRSPGTSSRSLASPLHASRGCYGEPLRFVYISRFWPKLDTWSMAGRRLRHRPRPRGPARPFRRPCMSGSEHSACPEPGACGRFRTTWARFWGPPVWLWRLDGRFPVVPRPGSGRPPGPAQGVPRRGFWAPFTLVRSFICAWRHGGRFHLGRRWLRCRLSKCYRANLVFTCGHPARSAMFLSRRIAAVTDCYCPATR